MNLRDRLYVRMIDKVRHGDKIKAPFVLLDRENQIIYASEGTETIGGWKKEQLLGHPYSEFMSDETYREVLHRFAFQVRRAAHPATYGDDDLGKVIKLLKDDYKTLEDTLSVEGRVRSFNSLMNRENSKPSRAPERRMRANDELRSVEGKTLNVADTVYFLNEGKECLGSIVSLKVTSRGLLYNLSRVFQMSTYKELVFTPKSYSLENEAVICIGKLTDKLQVKHALDRLTAEEAVPTNKRRIALDFMDAPFSNNDKMREHELSALHLMWSFVSNAWEEGRLVVGNITYDKFEKLCEYQKAYAQSKSPDKKPHIALKRTALVYPAIQEPSGNDARLVELRSVPELRKYINTELGSLEARLANSIPAQSVRPNPQNTEGQSLNVRSDRNNAEQQP